MDSSPLGTKPPRAVEVFFSYSHRDEGLRDELETHLSILMRQGLVSAWHDRKLTPGQDWGRGIDGHIDGAHLILLLVSADFLASDYCYGIEMARALERHRTGQAQVIPIILRSVDWSGAPFSALQALPRDARPVTSWSNRDEALTDVARGIRRAIAQINSQTALGEANTYYFSAQQQLIQENLRHFRGRDAADLALEQFLDNNPRGYFIVSAGPGEGKTALACHLVAVRSLPHHFVSRTGGRGDSRLILCSLLAQLSQELAARIPFTGSLPELAKAFEELLALLARRRKGMPVIVLVDALDELPPDVGADVPFLLDSPPQGVFFVLTSRPGDRLERLQDRLLGIPVRRFELGPLGDEDLSSIIRSTRPSIAESDLLRLSAAAQGNPLYVRAALDAMASGAAFDFDHLPPGLEGYYRRAMPRHPDGLLCDFLGLLAVSRKPLSIDDLVEITGAQERSVREIVLGSVRQFLRETPDGWSLYHPYLRDFLMREVVMPSELPAYHAQVADWLERQKGPNRDYRFASLTYHAFESRDAVRLRRVVSGEFLAEKATAYGYAVLEDLGLLARSLLNTEDPGLVEQCVAVVERLRQVLGGDLLEDAASALQVGSRQTIPRRRLIVPPVPYSPNVDIWIGLQPRATVTADFVEVVTSARRVSFAIGDAPGTGLKSAFVARFLADMFRRLIEDAHETGPSRQLHALAARLSGHEYFAMVSMECVELDMQAGLLRLASAGHPSPVLYSDRYRKADRLPVRGEFLVDAAGSESGGARRWEERIAEIESGDVLVLVSDGLTESGRMAGAFGYSFIDTLEQVADRTPREIGEALLGAWRRHPREDEWIDDVTLVVAKARCHA